VECSACGAITMLPPGQTADRCANCGSNRFVQSKLVTELVDPQVVALPRIDAKEAGKRARQWLGKGLLAPDDLSLKAAGGLNLAPAYYPFWTFDGTLEVNWSCEVNVGTDQRPRWEHLSGSEFEMFDDVMIPGLRKMSISEMKDIEPFNLKDLVEFKPDYLAGWNALTYDYPLSDASERAQGRIRERVTRFLAMKVAAGRQIRSFSAGGGKWVDMTYKHILLPLYVGNYHYKGKAFRIYVNGQTGKASGQKPRDWVKAVVVSILVFFILAVILFILYTLWLRMS
jgi:DNA-directed RNA polymerase subunit RPC12/RpoP